jgi:pyruvate formate lyase activating enzyme
METHGGGTGQPREAEHWLRREDGRIECRLCPHHCVLRDGQAGLCQVRAARGAVLVAAGYGHISSAHIDPIEKKPLYHFHPGAPIFSLGGWGCNFACAFCQNWSISQETRLQGEILSPADTVNQALQSGCRLLAYTYNEPLVGFEFVRDCSRLAREAGAKNVLVTNGYVETAPAAELLPLIDALNVDIKSMDDAFYRKQCRGTVAPVLAFCRQAARAGCHIEITNLVIPTLNDTEEQVERLAGWIAENLGALTPLHLSAYHPDYRSRVEATPVETLERAFEICGRHLKYVYLGNVRGGRGQDTACPGCGRTLITRSGYRTTVQALRGGACGHCGRKADVVVEPEVEGTPGR